MLKPKHGQKYEFHWLDTYNFIGWHYDDDIDEKTLDYVFQTTTGYFVKEAKGWYIVAMHKNPNVKLGFAEWGNISYIPKRSIEKILPLSS